jgi:hypothetical protein
VVGYVQAEDQPVISKALMNWARRAAYLRRALIVLRWMIERMFMVKGGLIEGNG